MKIIAESAFNHNGNYNELLNLALESQKAGADFFTAQVMNVNAFCKSDYDKYDLYKNTEFSASQWVSFFDFCNENDIKLIPCVLDEISFKLCYNNGFRLLKIHATDITNEPFLKLLSSKNDIKIILETQCATMFEIDFACRILGKERIESIFSGFSNYPTEIEDLNLNVIESLKKKYNLPIGFADHSLDTTNIPLMVLAKGYSYLEKHITISRNKRHYDYQVSLYPEEFSVMVKLLKHYFKALGSHVKHPVLNESKYRSIMYKKVVINEKTLKRSNDGEYFIEKKINSFDKKNIVVALIARLKSKRLEQKVLKPFHNNLLIVDLYNRISSSKKFKTVLATSDLKEDYPLCEIFSNNGFNLFKGDAVSVIDRMLSLAFEEKAASIFRVTGDNPFTDPYLMEEMVTLQNEYELDYVRVNNVPFGIGAELYSTKYLWNLYMNLETTYYSEYLTWYAINDKKVRIGCLDVESNNSNQLINLSVDVKEDYLRCKSILRKFKNKKFEEISLKDILNSLEDINTLNVNKEIKLPEGNKITLKDYLELIESKNYVIRKKIIF